MADATVIIHCDKSAPLLEAATARFPDIRFEACETYEALPALIEETRPDALYSVRFAGTPRFPRDAILGPSGPRWISNGGSGCDHFGIWDMGKVTVTNSAGVVSAMMAEYVMGSLLHFTLDRPGLDADKAAKRWAARTVRPLRGQTMLIVGLGHTGQAVAALAKAFGMTVIGTRARPVPTENVDQVHAADDLAGLWARADAIAICTPLLDTTRGLFDAAAFAAMKPGVLIADVSRGGVIVESALIEALHSGIVAGAALDVFETEPLPPENLLWEMQNVLISPHCSAVHDGWELASFAMFLDNLDRFISGQPLVNIVDPQRGY